MGSTTKASAKKQMAILFDAMMCSGCRQCMKACNEKQGFPATKMEEVEKIQDTSATSYSCVKSLPLDEKTVEEKELVYEKLSYRQMCRHCVTPSCQSVCPVGALIKTELGPVVYDYDKCIGCRYCMVACPFNVPRYEWDSPVPAIRKCDMCIDRLRDGKMPACVEACPNEATMCGTREEMLALARARMEEYPESYHPHIYGEEEIGGTSVLFLSPVELPELGYKPELGTEPLPVLTESVLHKLPAIVTLGGAALLGFWWMTNRRDEVAVWEAEQKLKQRRHDRDAAARNNGKESDDGAA